jgi:hypothetical protein
MVKHSGSANRRTSRSKKHKGQWNKDPFKLSNPSTNQWKAELFLLQQIGTLVEEDQ